MQIEKSPSISEVVYKIMQVRKMKQSAVAVAGGYTPREFNDILRGRKRIKEEDINRICLALDVTPNILFGYEDISSAS